MNNIKKINIYENDINDIPIHRSKEIIKKEMSGVSLMERITHGSKLTLSFSEEFRKDLPSIEVNINNLKKVVGYIRSKYDVVSFVEGFKLLGKVRVYSERKFSFPIFQIGQETEEINILLKENDVQFIPIIVGNKNNLLFFIREKGEM
jgi:hypothetical protein